MLQSQVNLECVETCTITMHCQKFVEGDAAPLQAVAVFAYHLLLQWVQTHSAGAFFLS